MTLIHHEDRVGVTVTTTGAVQAWRSPRSKSAHNVARQRREGLHLIAYSVAPDSIGRYALALDVLVSLFGERAVRGDLVWTFAREVLPYLIAAGATGMRTGHVMACVHAADARYAAVHTAEGGAT